MARDLERVKLIESALERAGLDALVCTLPANVRLLAGYWPVVGASVALATRDGYVMIVAPDDERELAEQGWANELSLFQPGSLKDIKTIPQSLRARLLEVAGVLDRGSKVGYEEASFEAASYSAVYSYGGNVRDVLGQVLPGATLRPAGPVLARLRSVLTGRELESVRQACRLAENAFALGIAQLREGLTENEAASLFQVPLSTAISGNEVVRTHGFVSCMSGANSAKAYASYQRSSSREILGGDFALVHCNCSVDGLWATLTRTYCVGQLDERAQEIYQAVFAARAAALKALKPGINAAEVDYAARSILHECGFAEQFKHPVGHGVGYAAIDHNALPCLHPASKDVLEAGMVVSLGPAVYFEGYGGVRHCDTVAVTPGGAEVLTPFQGQLEDLVLG